MEQGAKNCEGGTHGRRKEVSHERRNSRGGCRNTVVVYEE